MKTVKEVSKIVGVSIRTLRYYDEIGLLKPTKFTKAGYRLYDNKALKKLQEIMFFRELDIPCNVIKKIMENPNYDREQVLLTQKSLLEHKRNHLNGIIELITDVMKGVNTMNFEAFHHDDIEKIVDHTLSCMRSDALKKMVQSYGSIENVREYLMKGLTNEQAAAQVIKWYGGREKAVRAVLDSNPKENKNEFERQQKKNVEIYQQFMKAKETNDMNLAQEMVARLAENYKSMFQLENARNILLDLAKEYQQLKALKDATDQQFGAGCAEYIAAAIQNYYGV